MKVYGVAPDKGALTARALVLGNGGDVCFVGLVNSEASPRRKAAIQLHLVEDELQVIGEFSFDSRRINREGVAEPTFRAMITALASNRLFTALKDVQDDDALAELVRFQEQMRHLPAPTIGS